ncbi:hypothetical protein TSTA_001680 [Talaromyces stipitatus ATCC 10500]|uniref:Heterokaryon incompatibility domain-containing protein n=1 Tax=Talaromyces stipitatus (strain ATCC 10500 / CBS 375.48 / QM 6759 / NRRL 1006) TaxID=441959 RepID=B8MSY2_TALSN|nr:uncharacterized protein TSTA_001680 [Talaromyces stipitatus ATCC 10500]EED12097.1 hypothetical protein TSTA_001680 [Talaromyces stipitatus ATCC 10500]
MDAREAMSLRLTSEPFLLGTLDAIRARTKCPLCSLVSSTIPQESLVGIPEKETTCHLIWELDGRYRDSRRPQTRRLRIRWSEKRFRAHEAYLVLSAPSKYDKSDLDYPSLLNDETQFLGRRIGPTVNKTNLIREFLRLCENSHDACCTRQLGIEDHFADTLSQPYFGVIDIRNESLVPLPTSWENNRLKIESYATVSYVWGKSRDHRTTLANIQDRRKSGGLADTISMFPKALRQSVRLVSRLGIRYIWIDCICIIQDSSHSWNLNARAMHLIYGNSTLTICAADGENAETGLLAIDKKHSTDQKIAKCAPDVHLVLHYPPETSIETSVWNQRAWTFQERLLSRRCLIFTGGQVYFQCRSTSMSEDIFADKKGEGWSLDLNGAPLQTLTQLSHRGLWFYCNCVRLYTNRSLYEPFDILAAFSGMCRLMEETFRSPFIFGLPTSHFDFALLWVPSGRSQTLKKPVSREEMYKNMKFPSWSWCGWKSDNGIKYEHQFVEGCVADICAWLKDHTWIDWHVRDGYGTPQRLWDKDWASEDASADGRWKGYAGPDHDSQLEDKSDDSSVDSSSDDSDDSKQEGSQILPSETQRHVYSDKVTTTFGYDHRRQSTRFHIREDARSRRRSPPVPRPDRPALDPFGRPVESRALARTKVFSETGVEFLPKTNFVLTLPEYPFHVPPAESKCRNGSHREFPDLPILQFFTWWSQFYVIDISSEEVTDTADQGLLNGVPSQKEIDDGNSDTDGGKPCRCHIIDQHGDKCGSILLDSQWLKKQTISKFEFIAISEAKTFTPEEMPDWTYYIPKERIDSEWDVYFVLLVEHYPKEGLWRRVALGKVFQAAFDQSLCWKEIILG